MSNIEQFKKSDLFKGLPDEFVTRFADAAETITIAADEPVLGELVEDEAIFFICQGECRMQIMLGDPDEFAEFITLKSGDFIGHMRVFGASVPPGTCLAETDLELMKWNAGDWRRLCEEDPAAGYQLIFRVGEMVVHRLRLWGMKAIDSISWGLGM